MGESKQVADDGKFHLLTVMNCGFAGAQENSGARMVLLFVMGPRGESGRGGHGTWPASDRSADREPA
jgi:hypothetical protein